MGAWEMDEDIGSVGITIGGKPLDPYRVFRMKVAFWTRGERAPITFFKLTT